MIFLLVCFKHVLETKNELTTQEELWLALSLHLPGIIGK
jgi:hypothetical protein